LVESLTLRIQLGDQKGIAYIFYSQARIYYNQSEFDHAKQVALEALALQKAENDIASLMPTLRLLAQISISIEEIDVAQEYCDEALALNKKHQIKAETAAIHYTLTTLYNQQGKQELAQHHGNLGLDLCRHTGEVRMEGLLLYRLSFVHEALGDLSAAQQAARQGVAIFRQMEDTPNLGYLLVQLGYLYIQTDHPEKDQILNEAEAVGETLNNAWILDVISTLRP
ncbi:MAG: hypothetical protein AAF629_29865, partial [Chloroflexota bacterium]